MVAQELDRGAHENRLDDLVTLGHADDVVDDAFRKKLTKGQTHDLKVGAVCR